MAITAERLGATPSQTDLFMERINSSSPELLSSLTSRFSPKSLSRMIDFSAIYNQQGIESAMEKEIKGLGVEFNFPGFAKARLGKLLGFVGMGEREDQPVLYGIGQLGQGTFAVYIDKTGKAHIDERYRGASPTIYTPANAELLLSR